MVKAITWTLLVTVGFAVCANTPAAAAGEAKTRRIFQALRLAAEKATTLDESISDANLDKVLDPANTRAETCDRRQEKYVWAITALSERAMSLVLCEVYDEHLHVRIYKTNTANELILIAWQRGNHGQTWELEFFDWDLRTDKLVPRTQKSLGLVPPYENEFLTRKHRMKSADNHRAFFNLQDDGTIEAAPWTWMERRWEQRTPAYRIFFKWNGAAFSKIKTPQ